MTVEARARLWRDAEVLSRAAGPHLSPRLRRFVVRGDRDISFVDIQAAQGWAEESGEARERLARLTGAVLVSRTWTRTLSGEVLGRAAAAIGEAMLDAVVVLPDVVAPQVIDPLAAQGDAAALARLGAGALLACEPDGPRRDRFTHLFAEATRQPLPPTIAATAVRTAEGLRRAAEGAG